MLINYYFSGFLKEKTCILITHQLQYLTKVDQIVLLENVGIFINNINLLSSKLYNYTLIINICMYALIFSHIIYTRYG